MDINNVWDATNTGAGDGRTCSHRQSPLFVCIIILFTKKNLILSPPLKPFQ